MRLPAAPPFLQVPRRLRIGALSNNSSNISSRTLALHSLLARSSSVESTTSAQRATFTSSSSPSAPAASSQALLRQNAAHRANRKTSDSTPAVFPAAVASAGRPCEELLAVIGLEHDQSNAYYNQHLRAALDRKDLRTAAQIVSALRAPRSSSNSILSSLAPKPRKPVIWTQNYDALLFEWSQRGDLNQALALLDEMITFNRVSTRSFNTVLVACSKKRKLKQAAQVLQQMREAGKTPGPFAYANAINCCSKGDGNVKMATKFWNEMLHDGVEPSIEVVNCMLRVYNRASSRSEEALALVLQAIHAFDLTPDAISQSALVFSLLQDAKMDDAVGFLKEMHEQLQVQVEIDVLNAVLDACRQLEDWENAARVQHLIQGSQENSNGDANTKRLVALCEAKDASSPSVAWTFAAPRQLPISARAKQKELAKKEKQSPEKLRKVLQEIVNALENVDPGNDHVSSVLRRVENLKQWERIFTSAPVEDVEKFMQLCQKLEANGGQGGFELGAEFYNLYLFALARHAGKIETALNTLDEMVEMQRVDAMSFNNVLAMCGRHGRLAFAEKVLEKMKTAAHCAPSIFSYNVVLNCCALKRDVTKAEAYYEELKARGLSPDIVTINTLLKTYASMTKKVSQRQEQELEKSEGLSYAHRALKLFQRSSRKLKIEPSAATYFSLFRTFVQEADRIAALEEDNDEEGSDEDEGIHNQISSLIKRVCADAPAKSLDIAVFNAAIDYFQRFGDMKTTFDLFNTMKERGFEPNDTTLSLLFAVCSRSEQVDVGLKFLHYLMDEQDYQPTIDVLNGAIQLCASSNSPQDALELFSGIQSSGLLKPTEATFVNLIHAFGRQGDVEQALEYVHAMKEQLGFASLDAYNRVLQACAVNNAPLQAMDVLQHMKQHERLLPNAVSYNMVLKAFAKVHKPAQGDDSDDEEDRQQSGDFDDDDQNFGDDEDALDRVEEEQELEKFNNADVETRRTEAEHVRKLVTELLEEMQSNGVQPTSITYTRVMAACALRGDTDGVLLFFDELLHSKSGGASEVVTLLSESSLQNYLTACSRARDLDRVTSLMRILKEWHSETGSSVSPRVVLQLLNTLEDLGAWRRAVVVLRDVEATYGVRPNVIFFNRVMEICNAASEFHFVDQIFSTMRNATAYRIYPTSQSYIEAIYAAEQREEWVVATNLFLEMQQKCAKDEISTTQLQKIALGRYSEGRHKL